MLWRRQLEWWQLMTISVALKGVCWSLAFASVGIKSLIQRKLMLVTKHFFIATNRPHANTAAAITMRVTGGNIVCIHGPSRPWERNDRASKKTWIRSELRGTHGPQGRTSICTHTQAFPAIVFSTSLARIHLVYVFILELPASHPSCWPSEWFQSDLGVVLCSIEEVNVIVLSYQSCWNNVVVVVVVVVGIVIVVVFLHFLCFVVVVFDLSIFCIAMSASMCLITHVNVYHIADETNKIAHLNSGSPGSQVLRWCYEAEVMTEQSFPLCKP